MTKIFVAHFALLLICVFALSQLQVSGQSTQQSPTINAAHADGLTKLTAADLRLLLQDENPAALKQMSENPEFRKKTFDTLKQILALASQARKDGLADTPEAKDELESIRAEVVAANYDRRKNGGGKVPLGFISGEQIRAFYAEPANEAKFKAFIDKKIAQARAEGQIPAEQAPKAEQIASAREFYAKIRIYEKEAHEKRAELGEEYNHKTGLEVKLQQAQYLARLYAGQVLKDKIAVPDEEVQAYISRHPEFDTSAKKNKALTILSRAKSGEDFAKLAREFSEDPGSREQGGLYTDVKKGQFVPEFENAALALNSGQLAPNLVETSHGYHIVKLERKGAETYSVRHILFSTKVTDKENPQLPAVPVKEKVRARLEEEKEKLLINEILITNAIDIPENFTLPAIPAKQTEPTKKTLGTQKRQNQSAPSNPSTTRKKPKTVQRKKRNP